MNLRRETWESFVHEAVTAEPDDPHVRLLRDRLRAGAKVVRVHFLDGDAPAYRVVLERLRELSEQRIPHSASFTRWSLSEGVTMADEAEEVARVALRLGEVFAPIESEVGRDDFDAVLTERVKALAPPNASRVIADITTHNAQEGHTKDRLLRDLDAALRTMCAELTGALRYAESDAGRILDQALARWLDGRLNISRRSSMVPRAR